MALSTGKIPGYIVLNYITRVMKKLAGPTSTEKVLCAQIATQKVTEDLDQNSTPKQIKIFRKKLKLNEFKKNSNTPPSPMQEQFYDGLMKSVNKIMKQKLIDQKK